MNRIDRLFKNLKNRDESALVGFITAGDPDGESSMAIVKSLLDNGVDLLELGVPFSDPTADGPVIQRSSARALSSGMTLEGVIEMVKKIRTFSEAPIIIFTYFNPILAMGGGEFYQKAVEAGADGLLIVDLPPEESGELTDAWPGDELALIRLVAPTTPPERVEMITQKSRGFIYVVSMAGVTGSGRPDPSQVKGFVEEIRNHTNLPLCVGFGISDGEQVARVCAFADGAVVGSAFERAVEAAKDTAEAAEQAGHLAAELKAGTR